MQESCLCAVKLRLYEQKNNWLGCQAFIIHHIQGCQVLPQGFTAANTVSQPA